MTIEINTQPLPEHIGAAATALAGVLADGPEDTAVTDAASEALAVLLDVDPPFPPLPGLRPRTRQAGLSEAVSALGLAATAAEQAGRGEELLRVALATAAIRKTDQGAMS